MKSLSSKFPRNEKEIFDDLMSEILEEMVQIKPSECWTEEKIAALQIYCKETLNLEREFTTFKHKLHLNLKRTPKLQLLFDLIREASENNKGISEEGLHGKSSLKQKQKY